jgi:hypothetical protein
VLEWANKIPGNHGGSRKASSGWDNVAYDLEQSWHGLIRSRGSGIRGPIACIAHNVNLDACFKIEKGWKHQDELFKGQR